MEDIEDKHNNQKFVTLNNQKLVNFTNLNFVNLNNFTENYDIDLGINKSLTDNFVAFINELVNN